jgi:ABC-type uncharacterized transport system substrate-binding protein
LGGRTRRTPSRARAARLRSRRGVGAPALAAKHATSTIPIVIAASNDPVGAGIFASLAHPGGNVTGLSSMQEDIAGKELELLKAAFPGVERVAVLVNPGNPTHAGVLEAVRRAARTVRTELLPVEVRAPDQGDLDRFRDDGPPWVESRRSSSVIGHGLC